MTNNEKVLSEELKSRLNGASCICMGDNVGYINSVQVSIDENENIVPINKQKRILIPIGFISKMIDADVAESGGKIVINYKNRNIQIAINEKKILVDGIEIEIDVPAQVIDNMVFLPIRAITEGFGKKVFWDDRGIVVISDVEKIFDEQEDKNLIDELAKLYEVAVNSKVAKEKLKGLATMPVDAAFEFIRLERIDGKKYYICNGYIEEKVEENGELVAKHGADFGTYYVDRKSGEVYIFDVSAEKKLIEME